MSDARTFHVVNDDDVRTWVRICQWDSDRGLPVITEWSHYPDGTLGTQNLGMRYRCVDGELQVHLGEHQDIYFSIIGFP